MVPMVHSDMPKGRSSMAGRVPAVRQRRCPWGEVRLRPQSGAAGVCFGQQGPGRGPSDRWHLGMPGATGLACGFGWLDWLGLAAGPMVRSDVPKGRSSMAARGWLTGLALAIDQNRHSGRSRAQTRNPYPVAGDGIAAPAFTGAGFAGIVS